MVHRDPETGQFLAHPDDDEPVEITYSDHEFLNFRIVTVTRGSPDASVGTQYQIESDVLDLENDELAMLSWLSASLSVSYASFPEQGGEETRGGSYVNVAIGANLAGSEYLSQVTTTEGIQETDSEGGVVFAGTASDEPGFWAHLNAAAMSGYKDADADGSYSGGANTDNDRMRRVFREETMGGPYIDATDDVNIGVFVDKNGTETPLNSVIYGQMAFVVFEYENRRAEFAPYDPGASMR